MSKKILYTHTGTFHADDVFSTALLLLIYPNSEIKRVSVVPEQIEPNAIVYDIGFGRFDHHQKNKEYRENGIPYAAFGLLWRRFGKYIFSENKSIQRFDEEFVQPLDLTDNTGCFNILATMIADFIPTWDNDSDYDVAFLLAVDEAKAILDRRFSHLKAKLKSYDIVIKQYEKAENQDIIALKECIPWKDALIPTNAKFAVYPSVRGGYNAQVVPIAPKEQAAKIDFPKKWWGASINDLPNGVNFCHPSGFMLAANTQKDAIHACELALKEFNKE